MDDIWLLLGIAVTVVALAGLYCYIAKPVYQADVHVRVEGNDNTSQALTQTQTGAMINSGPQQAPTDAEIEIIKSRGVVAPVVEQFAELLGRAEDAAGDRQPRRAHRDAGRAGGRGSA